MTDDNQHGPGDQPLVGASEAALLLGVELSTFSHLRRREANEEGSKFPKPVATLRCGPIWKTSEIKRFATKYEKPRPGPKPGTVAAAKVPTKRTRPAKIAPEAVAGNGGANGEAKKVAAKKLPAKKAAAVKRVAKRVPQPVA